MNNAGLPQLMAFRYNKLLIFNKLHGYFYFSSLSYGVFSFNAMY